MGWSLSQVIVKKARLEHGYLGRVGIIMGHTALLTMSPYPGLVTTLEARKNGRRVRLGVSRGIRGNRWQPDRRREWRSDERAETRPHWEKFEDSRSISTARSGLDRHCFRAPLSWWRIYAGPGWAWCSRPTRQGTARRSWLGGSPRWASWRTTGMWLRRSTWSATRFSVAWGRCGSCPWEPATSPICSNPP